MNTTTQFFKNKDQYKAFRKAFAAAQNDKRAHKSYTSATGKRWDDKDQKAVEYTYRVKHDGWMSSAHYLLFNLVCGRNYYNGFSPKTRKAFVEGGGDADRGLNGAISHLASLISTANELLGQHKMQPPSWIKDKKQWLADKMNTHQATINAFLEPLGGVFTLADLARVQLPSFPGIDAKEHIGKKVSYQELLGDDVIDQTPDEDEPVVATAGDVGMPEPAPEKKGLLKRLFGG